MREVERRVTDEFFKNETESSSDDNLERTEMGMVDWILPFRNICKDLGLAGENRSPNAEEEEEEEEEERGTGEVREGSGEVRFRDRQEAAAMS